MRTMLATCVLVLFAAGVMAQDKKYEKEGKFTAKFPNGPEQTTKTASGLTARVFIADHEKGKGGFLIAYSDLPAELLKAPKPEQVLESGEKGLAENFKAKITKSSATKFGAKMYPARTIEAEREDWNLRGTVVLAGNRMYQVYVFGPKDFLTSKAADDFLASFTITE